MRRARAASGAALSFHIPCDNPITISLERRANCGDPPLRRRRRPPTGRLNEVAIQDKNQRNSRVLRSRHVRTGDSLSPLRGARARRARRAPSIVETARRDRDARRAGAAAGLRPSALRQSGCAEGRPAQSRLLGAFDSLNPYNVKALSTAQGLIGNVYQSLMIRSADEPFTLYGLIAQIGRNRRGARPDRLPPRSVGPVLRWILRSPRPTSCSPSTC